MKTTIQEKMNDTEKKVLKYCRDKELFRQGEEVVLGVSGGADSVCLLFVLYRLQKELGIRLHVVHINHLIRSDAGEDAAYVKKLCEDLGVSYVLVEKDVSALSKEYKLSEEETGRKIRYEAFETEAKKYRNAHIAVAHHKNDRAETMLFQLFRGSGIAGMGSIRAKRDFVVRPLLCLSRDEIEGYLAEKNIAYCIDSTNATDEYARNRIRHHILPFAEEQISQKAVEHLCTTADLMEEMADFIFINVGEAGKRCVLSEAGKSKVVISSLCKEHRAIQRELLFELLKDVAGTSKDISYVHVEQLMELCRLEGNREIHLPYGIKAVRSYDALYFEKDEEKRKSGEEKEIVEIDIRMLKNPGDSIQKILPGGKKLEICLINPSDFQDIPKKTYTKWFDCDKINESVVMRKRQTGDYIDILGKEGKTCQKKIKDYMINEKIPAKEREDIWLLASGKTVLWMVGYRINEKIKVTNDTTRILQVTFGENIEDTQ